MARASRRQMWADFVEGRLTPRTAEAAAASAAARAGGGGGGRFRGRVLGVDPSLRGTGWAVLDVGPGGAAALVASGTLRLKAALPFPECLRVIHLAVAEAVRTHGAVHAAFEETIHVQNQRVALKLGAARGAAIAAAAVAGLPVFDYAPRRVKQAVVGVGGASKEQVARTVRGLLRLDEVLPFDEADAAAVALCHAFTWREGA